MNYKSLYEFAALTMADRQTLETRLRAVLDGANRRGVLTKRAVSAFVAATIVAVALLITLRPAVFAQGQTTAPTVAESKDRTNTEQSIANLKQISLATQMYVQDYDLHFPRSAKAYNKLISPYLKNPQVYTSPLDAPGKISYKMSPLLAMKRLDRVGDPVNTVAFYEGEFGKPLYGYGKNTMAIIGFADGHVKLLTADGMKSVIWKPAFAPLPKATPQSNKRYSSTEKERIDEKIRVLEAQIYALKRQEMKWK